MLVSIYYMQSDNVTADNAQNVHRQREHNMQSQTPLSNGRRDDAMIKRCPFSHDVLFQVDHIVNLSAVVDTFL